jgi:hypothetical protein
MVPDPPAQRSDARLDVPVVGGQADPVFEQVGDDGRLGVWVDQ